MARVQMYSMEWCPYCAKAKALLGAKGIEYDEVDVTDDEAKAIEMVERTGQRGVPQFFIDDQWIGGYDSLAYLNATGTLDQMFGIESTVDLAKVWDVAVVGGGPAGLSAAMYAARKNLSTILIALDLGGQVGITHLVTNYPGMPVVEGPELVRLMFEQAYMYGLERLLGERVDDIRVDGRAKVLELASGKEVKARSVILASGAEKRRLEIPGEERVRRPRRGVLLHLRRPVLPGQDHRHRRRRQLGPRGGRRDERHRQEGARGQPRPVERRGVAQGQGRRGAGRQAAHRLRAGRDPRRRGGRAGS